MSQILRDSLLSAKTVNKGDYTYILHPISDGIPYLLPELLEEVTSDLMNALEWKSADYIVTMEAMGIPVATALSLKTQLPLNIIRKRKYDLSGEVAVSQKTGYGQSTLYINGLKPGDKVIIVDCVVSTGGTLISVIKGLQEMGVSIVDVGCVYGKGHGKKIVFEETDVKVKTLIDVDTDESGKVIEVDR